MHNWLMKFLDGQEILCLKQFGFQKKISTTHAVISQIENIEKSVDNKQIPYGVNVDLE